MSAKRRVKRGNPVATQQPLRLAQLLGGDGHGHGSARRDDTYFSDTRGGSQTIGSGSVAVCVADPGRGCDQCRNFSGSRLMQGASIAAMILGPKLDGARFRRVLSTKNSKSCKGKLMT